MRRSISGSALARLLSGWQAEHADLPGYAGLAAALRLLVLDGRLPLGVHLPSERDLAGALGVSRTTVQAGYARLREAGYLASRQGSGSWTQVPHGRTPAPSGWGLTAPQPGTDAAPVSRGDSDSAGIDSAGIDSDDFDSAAAGWLDLAHASPAAPEGALRRAYDEALDELPRHLPGHGYEPVGLPALRQAVADRYTARGLPTGPEEILVTSGAVNAVTLALRLFVAPGDRVLVEDPTYPNALDAARAAGARLVPVPYAGGHDDGAGGLTAYRWDLDGLDAALRQTAPRLAYLVPDYGNPTGALVPGEDRAALAALAARSRTTLLVDETLAELALDGDPSAAPPPLAAVAPAGADVLTVGATSKSFWGGLRIGWVRATPETVRRLAGVRASVDMGSPVVEQLAAAHLLRVADDVLQTRRAAFAARRDSLLGALAGWLPDWAPTRPAGGLVLWCRLDRAASSALVRSAEHHRLHLVSGRRFGVEGAFERYVRLPYTLPESDLADAVARLAAAHAAVLDQPTAAHSDSVA